MRTSILETIFTELVRKIQNIINPTSLSHGPASHQRPRQFLLSLDKLPTVPAARVGLI